MKRIIGYILITIVSILSFFQLLQTMKIVFGSFSAYLWFIAGIVCFFIIRPFFRKNEAWLTTFSHELTHAIASILMLNKMHSMKVYEQEGSTQYLGRSNIFITLAPYCFPIFTYFILLLMLLSSVRSLCIFQFLIGLTLGFHILCFTQQTHPNQTDIKQNGKMISYSFIFMWWLFNASIIL